MDEPEAVNRKERPRWRTPKKVREVLTIIDGLHLAKESYLARDKYTNDAKKSPQYKYIEQKYNPLSKHRGNLKT